MYGMEPKRIAAQANHGYNMLREMETKDFEKALDAQQKGRNMV